MQNRYKKNKHKNTDRSVFRSTCLYRANEYVFHKKDMTVTA